jgi:serine/threonine protein kinase
VDSKLPFVVTELFESDLARWIAWDRHRAGGRQAWHEDKRVLFPQVLKRPELDEIGSGEPSIVQHENSSGELENTLQNRTDVRFALIALAFAEVADAMQYLHENGIIHRDLKPAHLLLESDGRLHIAGFGGARVRGEQDLCSEDSMVGTPLYMSPELTHKRRAAAGPLSDIYSFGATLYETLTWQPPLRLSGRHTQDWTRLIQEEKPQPLGQVDPQIPSYLDTIVLKCLEKEPARRYQTAADLARDLRRTVFR